MFGKGIRERNGGYIIRREGYGGGSCHPSLLYTVEKHKLKILRNPRIGLLCWDVLMPQGFVNFRCFKNMNMDTLPVNYYSQQKGWMDCRIFEKWFNDIFVPNVKKFCKDNDIEYKILLLLDNAPSHPSADKLQSRDGKVTTLFLAPNTLLSFSLWIKAFWKPSKG